jgi:hypothetical protein
MGTRYDVFNGDADGICALHQLRLAEPRDSVLVTGPKREIDLLKRVSAQPGDDITVLDVALEKNRAALDAALAAGARVRYFDHHIPGEIPAHAGLDAHIDTDPNVCTSLLVNRFLEGRHLVWAVVAAFGDNLHAAARIAAQPLSLSDAQLEELKTLGEALNYNGYGETLADLLFDPAELYRVVRRHADPFTMIHDDADYHRLRDGYATDMTHAGQLAPAEERTQGAIYLMPEAPWSRRISGVFGNALANAAPTRAHAVLTKRPGGGYVVSVRAPLATKSGADELCKRFPTGGGRRGAAGINLLAEDAVADFSAAFYEVFAQAGR